jgi:hypothetical protein
VGGDAGRGDAAPDEAFVAEAKSALGGLGDDAGVGGMARDEIVSADARVFLVHHEGGHERARQIGIA